MKKFIFMRTHILEPYVFIEYIKLAQSLNRNDKCILFIDNTNNLVPSDSDSPITTIVFNGYKIPCFLYSDKILEESNLPSYVSQVNMDDAKNILWYNGDYPFYYMKHYFPDFDYYWCTEYDVFCNGESYKPFFKQFEKDKSDFISSEFRKIDFNNLEWCWSDYCEWIYKKEDHYRCFFPVIRLSNRAIDFLFRRRIEHGELFKEYANDKTKRWIFCELFVPTELMKYGYECKLMDTEYLRYSPVYNLNKERLFEFPDNKLYHPVR